MFFCFDTDKSTAIAVFYQLLSLFCPLTRTGKSYFNKKTIILRCHEVYYKLKAFLDGFEEKIVSDGANLWNGIFNMAFEIESFTG